MPRQTEPLCVAGVVLAAGASRRMGPGRNKMLLELAGEPLVRRAARRALAAGLAPVVVVLGDMVHVSAAALSELVSRAHTSDAPLVVSRYGDVTAPPLLFRRALFGELRAWTGEGCGKAVVQAHQREALYVDRGPEMLVDVDTPEDFQKAQNSSS